MNLYSQCIGCSFKNFAIIDEGEISDLFKKRFNLIIKQCYLIV